MIITLCGSARFEAEFHQWNQALSLSGHIVLSLAVHPSLHGGNKDWYTPEQKTALDHVHLAKIEKSDAIVVINTGGYLGNSTRAEIGWATIHKKSIFGVESGRNTMWQNANTLLAPGVNLPEVAPELWDRVQNGRAADVFSDQEDMLSAYDCTTKGFNLDQYELYVKLMLEELCEFWCACAKPQAALITHTFEALQKRVRDLMGRLTDPASMDNVETFDGLQDLLVVTLGAGYSAGFPMREGWQTVFRANMGKLGPDGRLIKREDGKVQKPAGWKPPNDELAKLLEIARDRVTPPPQIL